VSGGWLGHPARVYQLDSAPPKIISSNIRRCDHTYGCKVIMSFGFSVGDFLTVFEQANKLRKRFVNAPAQFDALSEQYSFILFYENLS
jgi:hypothetical protein